MAKVSRQQDQNPFVADGELSRKAEHIISRSTISRTEVRISDPDNISQHSEVRISNAESSSRSEVHISDPDLGDSVKPQPTFETVTLVDEKGDHAQVPEKPVELLNGASPATQKKQPLPLVEAEVTMVTSGKGQPLKAEQVELKTKGGCCTLQ